MENQVLSIKLSKKEGEVASIRSLREIPGVAASDTYRIEGGEGQDPEWTSALLPCVKGRPLPSRC